MIYAISHVGRDKAECEDTLLIGDRILSNSMGVFPFPEIGFICVADGVGGNCGGKEASTYVAEELIKRFNETDSLGPMISRLNTALITKAKKTPALSGMATTLTGIRFNGHECELIHIGNSRAYVQQGEYLKQITSDHTVYRWLISRGRIEEADACNKSEITSCLGGANTKLASNLLIKKIPDFRTMLLTTDGVHDYVSHDDLESIVSSNEGGQRKCAIIIESALKAGSKDDLSVILINRQEG